MHEFSPYSCPRFWIVEHTAEVLRRSCDCRFAPDFAYCTLEGHERPDSGPRRKNAEKRDVGNDTFIKSVLALSLIIF